MKKYTLALITTAAALLLAGCLPEDFIWWSPDGQTAAVRTAEGLRLAGTNGQLSEVILPAKIHSAAWLPDSSGLVVSRAWQSTNWAQAEAVLPADEVATAKRFARAIPDILKAGLTVSGGSVSNIEEQFFKPLGVTEISALESAWYCALSLYRPQIQAVVNSFTNASSLQAELRESETNGLTIHELSLLTLRNGRPSGEPRAIVRSVQPLLDPIVSSNSIVAFRTGQGVLKARTLDGKTSITVAEADVSSAAWSADGRALIYVVIGKDERVGEIRSAKVVSATGELLPQPGGAETLAMLASLGNPPRLAVLPDGRVLFASVRVDLPTRTTGLQLKGQFFLLDPAWRGEPPVPVEIKEGSLPEDLRTFSVSPDGRYVAVVESATAGVAVLDLATGKVKLILPSQPGWKSRMVPAWRNARELTFAAVPSPTATRPELNLWQPNGPARILSKDWPDSVVKPWLEAPGQQRIR